MRSPSSLGRTGRVTSQAGAARNHLDPEPAGKAQLPPRPVKPRTTFLLQKRCWWADGPSRPAGAAQARGPTAHALSHKASVGLQGHRKPPLQTPHSRSSWPGVPQEQRDVGGRAPRPAGPVRPGHTAHSARPRHPGDIQDGERLLRPPAGKAALSSHADTQQAPLPSGQDPWGGQDQGERPAQVGGCTEQLRKQGTVLGRGPTPALPPSNDVTLCLSPWGLHPL